MVYRSEYVLPEGTAPFQRLTLACDGEALTGLWIAGQKYFGVSGKRSILPEAPAAVAEIPPLAQAEDWLSRYFAGEKPSPRELPLAPEGSDFRRRVWALLLEIPYGQTVTYGEIAAMLGMKKSAAQAVGGAVGHNPISIIIPCHRVVGASGDLTGYAGGLSAKRWLLSHEAGDHSLSCWDPR